ncbi:hypothetical protein V8F06_001637 [Rhypophila decipiens]
MPACPLLGAATSTPTLAASKMTDRSSGTICDDADSPFIGCCESDPCGQPGGACLPEELFPMKLSSNKAARYQFLFPGKHPPPCMGCTQAQQGGAFSTIATVITQEKTTITVYAATTGTATVSTTPTSVLVAPSGTSTSEYDGGDAGGGGTSPGLIGCIVAGVVIGLLALLFGLSRTKRYKRIRAKRSDANRVSSLGQSWPETSHGYAHNGKDEDSGLNHARLTRLLQDSHGVRLSGTTVASQLLSPVFPNSRVSKLRVVNDTSSAHNSEQGEYVAASVTEVDESPDLNLQQVHRHPEVVQGSVASPTEDIQPAVAPLGGDAVKAGDQPGHDNEQQEAREVGLGLGFASVGKSAF